MKLKIAGDGAPDYIGHLQALAAGCDIEFVGPVEAERFYNECDLTVIPSLWEEPFGRVVAESLLMQVPVICSDRGAFPEILRRFPGGGVCTRPEDTRRFADDLRAVLLNLTRFRSYLARHRQEIRDYFSTESVGRRYVEFYGRVLQSSVDSSIRA